MISALNLPDNASVLDVACGTGDVLLEILSQNENRKIIVGAEFSSEMLKLDKIKLLQVNPREDVQLIAGNTLHLLFPANSFNAVTIAFGIRNIMDRKSALNYFFKCLKPGGKIAVLELATPSKKNLFVPLPFLFLEDTADHWFFFFKTPKSL